MIFINNIATVHMSNKLNESNDSNIDDQTFHLHTEIDIEILKNVQK